MATNGKRNTVITIMAPILAAIIAFFLYYGIAVMDNKVDKELYISEQQTLNANLREIKEAQSGIKKELIEQGKILVRIEARQVDR